MKNFWTNIYGLRRNHHDLTMQKKKKIDVKFTTYQWYEEYVIPPLPIIFIFWNETIK